jgi:hypothetical protein
VVVVVVVAAAAAAVVALVAAAATSILEMKAGRKQTGQDVSFSSLPFQGGYLSSFHPSITQFVCMK